MLALVTFTFQAQADQPAQTTALSGQVELARLVDLCAERLGLRIEYDANLLKGTVTLRLGTALSDQELWLLTNQILASRGFTSVTIPIDDQARGTISIIKVQDAPGMAKLQVDGQPGDESGFVSVVIRVEYVTPKTIVDALKLLLSKPSGTAVDLGSGGLVLVSDLRPRVDQALQLIETLDVASENPIVEKIPTRFVSAPSLAALVVATASARDSMTVPSLKGKLIADPDGDSIVLICPPGEVEHWHELIARFDERQPVQTLTYATKYFGAADIAKLLEQTARDTSPRGSGDRWRIVTDQLTSSLIVTATPAEHERIAAVMTRLDAMPPEARRPVRVFAIRDRDVRQILEVISKLIEAGVLEASSVEEGVDQTNPLSNQTSRTQTSLNIQPPLATVAQTSPSTQPSSPPIADKPLPGSSAGDNGRAAAAGQMRDAPTGAGRDSSSRLAAHPTLTLTADEGTNMLIATGEPRLLDQLADLIRRLDVRQPQVMIEVLVVSLSDSDALNLGVELQKLEVSGTTIVALSSLFGLGSPLLTGSGGSSGALPRGRGFTGVVLNPGDFSVVIQALQSLNKGRALSMPRVLVNNNQQATLNSVLQQPFSSTNASNTVATTSFGGTQDAGTTVSVKPQIAEGDHLALNYTVTLSAFVGQSSDPALPPPRQSNNLTSAVTIPDGYTVVVGGLEVTTESNTVSQIPLLGSIPGIGELFKNRAKARSRSRFFVFIHCDVMRNISFEDLKYISDRDAAAVGIDDGWPIVEPRIIR